MSFLVNKIEGWEDAQEILMKIPQDKVKKGVKCLYRAFKKLFAQHELLKYSDHLISYKNPFSDQFSAFSHFTSLKRQKIIKNST